jgi:hypothetical protein
MQPEVLSQGLQGLGCILQAGPTANLRQAQGSSVLDGEGCEGVSAGAPVHRGARWDMTARAYKFTSVSTLLDRVFALDYFPEIIPYHRAPGTGPLVVILGENASGKSFMRRLVQLICHKNEIEFMGISMEGRAKVSHTPWLCMVYGDESWQSTGCLSVNTVLGGINTCRSRDHAHVVFWDEPDIGLSDSWAAGVGQKLSELGKDPPKNTTAAFIVTHSRALVEQLVAVNPHYIHLGQPSNEAPQTLEEWLRRPIKPRDPSRLSDESHKRFKAIQKIIDRVKS